MRLQKGQIDLWYTDSDDVDDDHLHSYRSLLSEGERLRLEKYHFETDARQFLIARALVRCVLSTYMPEIRPKEWFFNENRYGKPSVGNALRGVSVYFNLSHSGNVIMMAVSHECTLGVDVESHTRNIDFMTLTHSCFSQSERSHIEHLPPVNQRSRFFDIWTLKEAYIKARGLGLSIPLEQFSFELSVESQISIEFEPSINDTPHNWYFWCLQTSDFINTHKCALAVKSTGSEQSLSMYKMVPMSCTRLINFTTERTSQYLPASIKEEP